MTVNVNYRSLAPAVALVSALLAVQAADLQRFLLPRELAGLSAAQLRATQPDADCTAANPSGAARKQTACSDCTTVKACIYAGPIGWVAGKTTSCSGWTPWCNDGVCSATPSQTQSCSSLQADDTFQCTGNGYWPNLSSCSKYWMCTSAGAFAGGRAPGRHQDRATLPLRSPERGRERWPRMSKQERFCFCRLEAKGFMIMCDGCRIWFHGRCVKMSKKSSEAIEFWYCMWCNLYRDSAKSVIEEQEKIREDILKIKGELEHLKVAIKMNTGGLTSSTDSHASSDPSEQSLDQELIIVKKNLEKLKEENLVYQKNHADILTRVDSLKRELVSKQKELNSIEVNFKNYQEESLSSKRRYDSDILNLKTDIASKQEELDKVKLNFQNFQEEKQLLEKNLNEELDKAYREISSLNESNKELASSLAIKRRKLSKSKC